jgi:hypothetical protein
MLAQHSPQNKNSRCVSGDIPDDIQPAASKTGFLTAGRGGAERELRLKHWRSPRSGIKRDLAPPVLRRAQARGWS